MENQKVARLDKGFLNIIRTTMRNNIELTHIADNKANVLLSLSTLMLTLLVPFVLPHFAVIKQFNLFLPIGFLVLTCFFTIYISAMVLRPGKFNHNKARKKSGSHKSPFFFGNIYEMGLDEYQEYIANAVSENQSFKMHLVEDMYYVSSRLGEKMTLIRNAYNVFMVGVIGSISVALGILYYYG
jgi:hypothetical protein